ncbi:MAG: OmpA family protein [Rhodobacterales bacterium]|nr:OmpA family protein [Rhodobacterales bacterium]
MRRFHTLLGAALLGGALLASVPALAGDMKQFNERPPTQDEVSKILFPELNDMGQGRTRSGITRGLVFSGSKGQQARENLTPEPQGERAFGMAVEFDFDSARISDSAKPYLDSLGAVLARNRAIEFSLTIVGHTDAKGTDDYNLALSQERALAVERYLVEQHGVDPKRLRVVGVGESEPLDSADPDAAVNRRVEFRRAQ